MSYSVTEQTLERLEDIRKETKNIIQWQPLFQLPVWLSVWYEVFAHSTNPLILTVADDDSVIGVAPLLVEDKTASIIGSANVCDYFDFPIVPGKEQIFYNMLLGYLKKHDINMLDCRVVRPDSTVVSGLVPMARQSGLKVSLEPDEVTIETDLPSTWEDYLQSLDGKQRHEIRRKLRRLNEAGDIKYRFVTGIDGVPEFSEIFLKMFVESRSDKATFLTGEMNVFFRKLLTSTAEAGLFKGAILELDNRPVATLTAFDYEEVVYLYNSGYDPEYSSLSVGILSKALLIKESIETRKKKFDFLKGGEQYKYFLGGKEVKLQRCRVEVV